MWGHKVGGFPAMPGKRGNRNWGRPLPQLPLVPSQFERVVRILRLTPERYETSVALRDWCKRNRNRNRCYIPEGLVKKWGIVVDVYYGDYVG